MGKTTAACSLPKPLVVPIEDGLVALPDVQRIPRPASGFLWSHVEQIVDDMAAQATGKDPEFQTLVLDALSGLEALCWAYTCQNNFTGKKWKSIETAGYGKGYTAAQRTWGRLALKLDRLTSVGVNVVLLAHAELVRFSNPDGEDFDRYEIALDKRARRGWYQWARDVHFLRHDIGVATKTTGEGMGEKTKRTGQSLGRRLVHTVWDATYDAKQRTRCLPSFTLPDPLDGSYIDALTVARSPESLASLRKGR